MTTTLTEGKPFPLIMKFMLPLLFGNLFQQAYNMADTAIVGQTLGADALAAVGVSSSVQFLVLGFCIGIACGFAIPIATEFGADRKSEMRRYVYHGAVITAIFAVVLTVVCALLCNAIITMLKAPAEIFDDSYRYLFIIFLGIPCTLLYNYVSAILRAIGDSRTPFLFLAFSSVLNIFLDFFCILVLKWGVGGAAFATIFSQGLSGILCLLVILKKYEVLHIQKEERTFDKYHAMKMLNMGVPMGLQYSITAIGCMVMQTANNSLGTVYVSGFAAGTKINSLMQCPYDALATAVCTFASQNYGYGDAKRIRQGFAVGAAAATVWGIASGILLQLFAPDFVSIFVSSDNEAVIAAGAQYLQTISKFFVVLGFLNVFRYSTQGLGWSKRAILSGVFEMIARILVSGILVPKYGYTAVCFADPAAWIAADLYILPTCRLAYLNAVKVIAEEKRARSQMKLA